VTENRVSANRSHRPSIRDVARRAGVSAACASNVLNRRRRQDDPIGLAVLAAVADLGYRANTMAANLRRINSRLVGVVLPDFENPFFGALLSALEREAEASGYRLTAASSRDDPAIEAREVAELLGWRVAGLLLVPTLGGTAALSARGEVPVVVVDRVTGAGRTDEVSVDNDAAARAVTERLVALGHRHILLAASDPQVPNVAERIRGAEAAAGPAGATIEVLPCGWTVASAEAAFRRRFAEGPVPTAVFTLNNLAALAAYGAARRRGLTPGIDLALASFDDSAWMAHMHPAVAAVAQPVEAIAAAAWDRLTARIDGDDGAAVSDRVPCRFIERGTLVPPPSLRGGGP
jgi:LacI family transcriptional regulator